MIDVRGWVLEFEARPKSEHQRTMDSFPMIGVYPALAAWQGSSAAVVRSKIEHKAAHYGDLDAPLVIAIHDLTPFGTRSVIEDAFWGMQRPYWTPSADSANRVSAVLAAWEFGPPSIARRTPELWVNEHATRRLPPGVLVWPDSNDERTESTQLDPALLLGLPTDWPGRPFRDP